MSSYDLILADPPWAYNARNHASKFGGGAGGHYPMMSTREIEALPIGELAGDDAVLLVWATWPRLVDALAVIAAWGFVYKTLGMIWVKSSGTTEPAPGLQSSWPTEGSPFFGVGYYAKSNTEPMLLATRGRPAKPATNSASSVLIAPRLEHSRKPDEALHRLEALWPDARRLELFARRRRPGWDAWGNQVESTVSI